MKIMVVASVKEGTETSKQIKKDDIFVAVNGMCVSAIPPEKTVEDWIEMFKKTSSPRLCSLFRAHPSYASTYNPLDVTPLLFSHVVVCSWHSLCSP